MADILLNITIVIWMGALAGSMLFDRDYGRASCWQRDVGGWCLLVFMAPFIGVLVVALSPVLIWLWFTRARPTQQGEK